MGEWRGFYPEERKDPACLRLVGGWRETWFLFLLSPCLASAVKFHLCLIKSLLTQVWEAAATSTVIQIAFHNEGNQCVCVCDFHFSFMDFS